MASIDFNCDLGEGASCDAELMPLITSANIACGGHAGDENTMRETVALALRHGVVIGAHPGFADRTNFGRREIDLSVNEIEMMVRGQIERLRTLGPVRHVKPHGALYNMAARDDALAMAIVKAVRVVDGSLLMFAPAGSALARAATSCGMRVCHEVFADRSYQRDGTLTPRSHPDALIRDEREAAAQVIRMIQDGVVRATDGTEFPIVADTVCIHGDGPQALAFARRLRAELTAAKIEIRAPHR